MRTDGSPSLGFILGLPRSGTTLLSAMLDNHPQITVPAEPWLMLALESLGQTSIRHPANSQAIGSAVRDFLPGARKTAVLRAAAIAAHDDWRERTRKPVFIDKTPRYHLIAGFLAEVFPDARFIVLLRDPFDVAASYRTTWNVDLPELLRREVDDPLAFDLPIGLARLDDFIAAHPDKTQVIHYEDLATDPTATLALVLDHLGLPADESNALTRLDGNGAVEGEPVRMGDRKILSTAGPHARSIGGGPELFDAPDRQILLDVIGAGRMRALGYGATVDALLTGGTLDRGADLAAHYRARMEAHIAHRHNDMARESTLGVDLPPDVQARTHTALTSDKVWEAEVDSTLAILRDGVGALDGRVGAFGDELRSLLETELGKACASARVAETEAARLAGRLERAEVEMARSHDDLAARDHALMMAAEEKARLTGRLEAAEQEIADLRRDVSLREIRIHAMLASTSWKLTAPLRTLVSLFRSEG